MFVQVDFALPYLHASNQFEDDTTLLSLRTCRLKPPEKTVKPHLLQIRQPCLHTNCIEAEKHLNLHLFTGISRTMLASKTLQFWISKLQNVYYT